MGLGIFMLSEGHFGTENVNTTNHAKSLYYVTKRQKHETVCSLVQFGLSKFCVSYIASGVNFTCL